MAQDIVPVLRDDSRRHRRLEYWWTTNTDDGFVLSNLLMRVGRAQQLVEN
jgi:hypothetical protein